jgi:hypothetical protein
MQRWQKRLGRSARLRVGVVWAGSPTNAVEHERAPGYEPVARLWELGAIEFFILQKGAGRQALEGVSLPGNVTDLGDELNDFSDTAAVLSLLDVLVTTDTSVAHVAGALGCPMWMMLHASADWRWREEGGESVWYPAARLFRQTDAGAWAPVIAAIATALGERRITAAA